MVTSLLILRLNIGKAWTGTVNINPDGSVTPADAPVLCAGDVYTLTDDINCFDDGIIVTKDNIVLDGADHFLVGSWASGSRGVYLYQRTNVTVKNFRVRNFDNAVVINASFWNSLVENDLSDNWDGLEMQGSDNNSLYGNDFGPNMHIGVEICSSNNNSFVHNSFLMNAYLQVLNGKCGTEHLVNCWHGGYPSGGNYWTDFDGEDEYSGSFQNETGSDSIGDSRYIIAENTTDNYPLMGPWTPVGYNVTINHVSGVSLSYAQVVTGGITTFMTDNAPPDLPFGCLNAAEPPLVYSISTTTIHSGSFNIAVAYGAFGLSPLEESNLSLMHWNSTSLVWENITTQIDHVNNVAYGQPSSLSLFALIVPLFGDVNHDGTVDIYDAIMLANCFGSTQESANWNPDADINQDGNVDVFDAIILANNYGKPH